MNTTLPDLKADCSTCADLCCVAFAFEKGASFSIDKPAGAPCPHLNETRSCEIYNSREDRGFHGCTIFDCHGAGQRVTQDLFNGQSWDSDHEIRRRMIDAFLVMLRIHKLLLLLSVAAELPLTSSERSVHAELMDKLSPQIGWTEKNLAAFDAAPVEKEVHAFLKTLSEHATVLRSQIEHSRRAAT